MGKIFDRPTLAQASAESGVLATNVMIHERGPDGPTGESVWYGPSYPEAGPVPADVAETLPPSVWDVRANWPTPSDAAAVGLAWS